MKIVFWNCGGTGNLGDDLCHQGAVALYRKALGEFEVEKIFRLNEKTIEMINAADKLVIGGGRILGGTDFLSSILKYEIKVPIAFVGVGVRAFADIEPFKGKITAEVWSARDNRSKEMLDMCGFKPTEVMPDLSSIIDIPFTEKSEIKVGALNLRAAGKPHNFTMELRALLPREVVLASFNTTGRHKAVVDGEVCEVSDSDDTGMMAEIADGREVIGYRGGWDDPIRWAAQLGRFHWMVCERLHACILARRLGIPFLAVNSNEKIERYMVENGMKAGLIEHSPEAIADAVRLLNA